MWAARSMQQNTLLAALPEAARERLAPNLKLNEGIIERGLAASVTRR